MAEEDDEDDYDSDEGLLLMYDHNEDVGDENVTSQFFRINLNFLN